MDAVLSGFRDEVEGWARGLLSSVAHDYSLSEQELVHRYLSLEFTEGGKGAASPVTLSLVERATHPATSAPAPAPQVPTNVSPVPAPVTAAVAPKKARGRKKAPGIEALDLSKPLSLAEIESLTIPSLKDLCKVKGLKLTGSRPELVGRIMAWQADPNAAGLKPRQGGKKKREAPAPTVHNHPLDAQVHADCSECAAHGNPLSGMMQEFEVVAPSAALVQEDEVVAPSAPPLPEEFRPDAPIDVDMLVAEPIEAPEAAEAPEAPVSPEAPEAPVSPVAPVAAEAPVAPVAPVAAEAPVAPVAPEPVKIPTPPEAPADAATSLQRQLAAILGEPDEEDDICQGEYSDEEDSDDELTMDYGDELEPEE